MQADISIFTTYMTIAKAQTKLIYLLDCYNSLLNDLSAPTLLLHVGQCLNVGGVQ
jgi:hypothetical protein